jgi:alkylation response protein AidB-like acyl-CoA dehydrogenase
MDFSLPPTLSPILERVRAFVAERVIPLERLYAERGSFRGIMLELREARAEVKAAGLWLPQMSKEHGGMGLTLMEHARVSEELGRSMLGHYVFGCQAPDAGNMELLAHFGSDAQKREWLVPLAAGDIRSCFGMTEPDRPGSNPTWLGTTARKDGSDYVIDGHKWFTTGADGSAFCIVMAVTSPDAPSHARASQIIVPMSTPGLRFVRNISVMGHAGDDWMSHAELRFEGVRVPQSNRLGDEGLGFLLAQERLGPGRIHHAMRWVGICERAFDLMCTRAATREVEPGKPLGTRQMVQEWIADARANIHASRLMILHAAWKMDKEGSLAAREEISLVKFFVADVLQKTIDRAVQTHGALGITDDTPLAAFYRFERAARIYDGADEVHKANVARRILRGYGLKLG